MYIRLTKKLVAMGAASLLGATALVGGLALDSRADNVLVPAAACTAKPITDPLTVVYDGPTTVSAWEVVKFSFSGSISDGHCAGDSVTFDVPAGLNVPGGNTYELKTEDGEVAAIMTTTDGKVTVTLTKFVETHTGVTVNGWLQAQVKNEAQPGETLDVNWDVNGKISPTPVEMGECPEDCTAMPEYSGKWGSVESGDILHMTVETPATTKANQEHVVTDTLTSPGQQFDCSALNLSGMSYTVRDAWGDPANVLDVTGLKVDSCTTTKLVVSYVVPEAGAAARIFFQVKITDPTLTEWLDTADIVRDGETLPPANAVVKRFDGGGSASGTTPTVPPTTTPPTTAPPTTTPPTTAPPTTTPPTTAPPTSTPPTTAPPTTMPPTTAPPTTPPGLPDTGESDFPVGAVIVLAGLAAAALAAARRR